MDKDAHRPAKEAVDRRGPVCVVDDDESMRWSLQALFDAMDIEAHAFASGQDFLASQVADACVCLISDVRMKMMTGFQLVEALAASGRNIPVIFISGHADDSMRARAFLLGAAGLLDKPFNDAALLQLVDAILAPPAA